MPFVVIAPGRWAGDAVGIILKKDKLIFTEQFLKSHDLENMSHCVLSADLLAKKISVKFKESTTLQSYPITNPQGTKNGIILIGKILGVLEIKTQKQPVQVEFEYHKEFENVSDCFILDLVSSLEEIKL